MISAGSGILLCSLSLPVCASIVPAAPGLVKSSFKLQLHTLSRHLSADSEILRDTFLWLGEALRICCDSLVMDLHDIQLSLVCVSVVVRQ